MVNESKSAFIRVSATFMMDHEKSLDSEKGQIIIEGVCGIRT